MRTRLKPVSPAGGARTCDVLSVTIHITHGVSHQQVAVACGQTTPALISIARYVLATPNQIHRFRRHESAAQNTAVLNKCITGCGDRPISRRCVMYVISGECSQVFILAVISPLLRGFGFVFSRHTQRPLS